MIARLFHALIATSIVAGAALAASYGVTHWMPAGRMQDQAERLLTAPGQAIYAGLESNRAARKMVEAQQKRLAKAGVDLRKLQDSLLGRDMRKAEAEAVRFMHLYNIGVWAGIGFAACLVLTIFFGISSIESALALGFKVTLALIFLQGALILGGVLVLRKLAG
jgi:hypothetical protein